MKKGLDKISIVRDVRMFGKSFEHFSSRWINAAIRHVELLCLFDIKTGIRL